MDKIKKYLPFAALGLALLAFLMIFFPAIVIKGGENIEWSGWGVSWAFLYDDDGTSVLNALTYLILLGGIALFILSLLQDNKLFLHISIGCFFVTGIMFFCTVEFLAISARSAGEKSYIRECFVLGWGAIIAGICSIFAAICAAAPTVMDMLDIK